MRVAVVTPYYREPQWKLERNLESVQSQTYPCDHVLVADGYASGDLATGRAVHIKLPTPSNDCGDTPRAVGIAFAASRNYDAITLLDADCFLLPTAIERYVERANQQGVALVVGKRELLRPDGRPLMVPVEPPEGHIDTNCYFFTRAAFGVLLKWALIPPALHVIGDRVVRKAVHVAGLPYTMVGETTVMYETRWAAHYRSAGQSAPSDAKSLGPAELARVRNAWESLDPETRARYCASLGFSPFDPD